MIGDSKVGTRIALGVVGLLIGGGNWAEGGGWAWRRAPAATPAPRTASAPVPTSFEPSPYPMLGTFYPTPWLMVRGNWPAGGGYSPLGAFGNSSMDIYGPMSAFRGYTAPVATYTRGYDGRPVAVPGNSFSTPNRPETTPVVYPTPANYFYRIRESGDPPWWGNSMDWIDQN